MYKVKLYGTSNGKRFADPSQAAREAMRLSPGNPKITPEDESDPEPVKDEVKPEADPEPVIPEPVIPEQKPEADPVRVPHRAPATTKKQKPPTPKK